MCRPCVCTSMHTVITRRTGLGEEEIQDSHDEYQGAWNVAINQGVVLRLNLQARQTSLHWSAGINTQSHSTIKIASWQAHSNA